MTARTPRTRMPCTCTPQARDGCAESGFTLVEVLVALFVFSIISVATLQALTTTLRAKDGVAAGLDRVERLAVLDRVIRDDIANLSTRPTRDPFGTPELMSFELYGALDLLTFTREGRANPEGLARRGELMRVRYDLEDGALIRRSFALPTPAVTTPEVERVLVEGVSRVSIAATRKERNTALPGGEASGLAGGSASGAAGGLSGGRASNTRVPPGEELPFAALSFLLEFEDGRELTLIAEAGS